MIRLVIILKKNKRSMLKINNKATVLIFLFVLAVFPFSADAASFGFTPSALSPSVGSTFSTTVYVSSPDQSINAASGAISFPPDSLEVVGVYKTNSVMNLWVQEPSFLNSQGRINFEGVALNPGYTGTQGAVLNVVFKAKSPGRADIRFASGSILANDGSGTNVLDGMGTASIVIGGNTVNTVDIVNTTPSAKTPIIVSESHPDQSKWYADNSPEFSWRLPAGVTEVRTVIGKSAHSTPTVSYVPPISKKKVNPLPDGVHYFALQIRTADGWGDVVRHQIRIDTAPPDPFQITFPEGNKSLGPQPVIQFGTTDDQSGISYYEIRIGGTSPVRVEPSAVANSYVLASQYPGNHTISVTAVDKAGNTRSASADFSVESIDAPIITFYQEEIESGEAVRIRGTTYPNSEVTILIRQDDEVVSEEYAKSNNTGDFSVAVAQHLAPGAYAFTARVTNAEGARSDDTQPLTLIVNPAFLTNLTNLVLSYLSAGILAILALGGIVGLGTYLWYRLSRMVRRLRREAKEAERMLKKTFSTLRKDVDNHIIKLKAIKKKRKLTVEEVEFLERFGKNLADSEDVLTKEIEDISRS